MGRRRDLKEEEICSKWGCDNRYGILWGRSLRCTLHQEYRVLRVEPEPVEVEEVEVAPVQLKLFGN